MKSIKTVLTLILGLIIIIFAIILSPLIKIRFGYIITSRIGQLCYNLDNYLSHKKTNNLDELAIFNYDKKISNKLIFKLFSKKKNIIFSKIALPPIIFLKTMYPLKYHSFHSIIKDKTQKNLNYPFIFRYFISHIDILHPRITNYSMMPSNINLDKFKFKELGLFQELKKDRFICFHNRDESYQVINDANNHDFRNFDFNDYSLVIEYLKKKNNSVIKLGETFPEENFKIPEGSFFSSKDFSLNEEIDYLLNSYSRYNIIGNSGIVGISYILRKKIIYANLIPLNLSNLSYCSPGSIILPKKIFDNQKGRLLTFRENTEINFSIHSEDDPYFKNNLRVINNSPQEILDAAIEMDERLEGNSINSDAAKFNDQFWKSIINNNEEKINFLKNELKLSVSYKFLKDNQNLL